MAKKSARGDKKIVSFLENTIHLRPPARKTATLEASTTRKLSRLDKTHPPPCFYASPPPPKIHLYNDPQHVGRAGIKNHSSSHTVSRHTHREANWGGCASPPFNFDALIKRSRFGRVHIEFPNLIVVRESSVCVCVRAPGMRNGAPSIWLSPP